MEKYLNSYCKYCTKKAIINYAEVLKCCNCKNCVHIKCLKRQAVPGGIFGDTFFKFTCAECSISGNEVYVREKLTWYQAIILIMYHLQNKSAGTANSGFFHWRNHLVAFIDKKWDNIFLNYVKRRKNWRGTVSGSLSHFSPCFFTSGTSVIGANGWWKLTFPELTPTTNILIYNELSANKVSLKSYNDLIHIKDLVCKYVPVLELEYFSPASDQRSEEEVEQFMEEINVELKDELNLPQNNLFSATTSNTTLHHDLKIDQVLEDVSPLVTNIIPKPEPKLQYNLIETTFNQDLNHVSPFFKISSKSEPKSQSNLSEVLDDVSSRVTKITPKFEPKQKEKKEFEFKKPAIPLKKSKTNFYDFWKKHGPKNKLNTFTNVVPLREIEEETLHSFMMRRKCNYRFQRALRRKLHLRHLKRKHSLQTLNVDEVSKEIAAQMRSRHYTTVPVHETDTKKEEKVIPRGVIRLNTFFRSPYTNRLLKPFIRRDLEPKSLWLDLMTEMMSKVSLRNKMYIDWTTSSLDYVYVRPNHIPVINYLCERNFWPGIDLSEALEYPEFSCVVLYKKLIVAFGFMVPDVKFNEAYISFIFVRPEWRKEGIATFMIYHLIQTCMGKDITLHVAIDNPAIFLYQKFGFKVEEVILNFYDTYLRDDSKQCKHAFFLRLER